MRTRGTSLGMHSINIPIGLLTRSFKHILLIALICIFEVRNNYVALAETKSDRYTGGKLFYQVKGGLSELRTKTPIQFPERITSENELAEFIEASESVRELSFLLALSKFCSENSLECPSDEAIWRNCVIFQNRDECSSFLDAATQSADWPSSVGTTKYENDPLLSGTSSVGGSVRSLAPRQRTNNEATRNGAEYQEIFKNLTGRWRRSGARNEAEYDKDVMGKLGDSRVEGAKIKLARLLNEHQRTSSRLTENGDQDNEEMTGKWSRRLELDADRKPAPIGQRDSAKLRMNPKAWRARGQHKNALEETRRLFQQKQRQSGKEEDQKVGPLSNSVLIASNVLGSFYSWPQEQRWQQTESALEDDALHVPKRLDTSSDDSQSVTRRRFSSDEPTITSGWHRLVERGEPNLTTQSEESVEDAMQCNMRRFTFKATKRDEAGNQCMGLVTASICYGGCDTGEIADWLFPYKKPVHKVCGHGGRIKRRALLTYCTSPSGAELPQTSAAITTAASNGESLRDYYYVDARDCVCRKCMSVDTNCLGTMYKPHLQTLNEAVAEIGGQQQIQNQYSIVD